MDTKEWFENKVITTLEAEIKDLKHEIKKLRAEVERLRKEYEQCYISERVLFDRSKRLESDLAAAVEVLRELHPYWMADTTMKDRVSDFLERLEVKP